jgi:hypothetical protein
MGQQIGQPAGQGISHRVAIFAALVCCALFPANSRAQSPAPAAAAAEKPGVPRTIVLPKLLLAGEHATLAVLDSTGRLIPAVDIDLSSGAKVSTDDTGRASFVAPKQTGMFTARITETSQEFTATVLALPPGDPPSPGQQPLVAPHLIALQDRFDVLGSGFSGDAYLNTVTLGNLPALVLAASPVALVAQPNPQTAPGDTELAAGLAGGHASALQATVISLQVIGPTQPISPGQLSAFTVLANGSMQRLIVQVRSLTPEVVSLPHGASEFWFTTGGSTNAATIKMRGATPGNYQLSARLVAPASISIETARQELLGARQTANSAWQKALDAVIKGMSKTRNTQKQSDLQQVDTQRAAHFRRQIERLLHNRPEDPMGLLIRLAWQSLDTNAD